jgi:AcrR family transcriptional regulator
VERDRAEARARSYRKASERRAEILSRAIDLFAERGVGALLRAIGDAIGVTHAAFRYYFPSRDVLLVEVCPTYERLEVELYATLTTDAPHGQEHPLTREFVRERLQKLRAYLAERIGTGQRAGTIAADIDPEDESLPCPCSNGMEAGGGWHFPSTSNPWMWRWTGRWRARRRCG